MAQVVTTVLLSSTAMAQVVTDGSVGPKVTLIGSDIVVEEQLGTRRGDNLFHSFASFDVQRRGRVEFSGDAGLKHVLARVTGNDASLIDGTIASSAGNASLWIINDNGIRFGSHAEIDVGGSFHAATASEIRFADGSKFDVDLSGSSTLSITNPNAFGFGDRPPQPIDVDGSNFMLKPEQQLTLAAGDIRITGDGAADTIKIVGGRLFLAGAAAGDEVQLDTIVDGEAAGRVTISENARIDLTGNGGGEFQLKATTALIDDFSQIDLRNTGAIDAGIALDLRTTSLVVSDGAQIMASASDTGAAGAANLSSDTFTISNGGIIEAGAIVLNAGDLTIDGGAEANRTGLFSSVNYGTANADDITVYGGDVEILRGGQISSSSYYAGDAGRIAVVADNLVIDGGGVVNTGLLTVSDYGGYGGPIEVRSGNAVTLRRGGLIRSSASGYYAAGDITLSAASFDFDGRGSDQLTGVFSTTSGYGRAGNVQLTSDRLIITGGAQLSTDTLASGDAGRIEVVTTDLMIDGTGAEASSTISGIASRSGSGATGSAGDISIVSSGLVDVRDGGQIISSAEQSAYAGYDAGAGSIAIMGIGVVLDGGADASRTGLFSEVNYRPSPAGEVVVSADSLSIQSGAQISSSSVYGGDAGRIGVNVGRLSIDGGGIVSTGILNISQYGGYGGLIDVAASESVSLFDGGLISSSTGGYYAAGDIAISAPRFEIDGRGGDELTGILSNSSSYGRAGTIALSGDRLEIVGGGLISTDTLASGDAGNISVDVDKIIMTGLGAGLSGTTGISSRSAVGAYGMAGEISITSSEVMIDQGALVTTETSGIGDAGSILITTDQLTLLNGGLLRSSSQGTGAAGNIELDTVQIDFADATVRTEGQNSGGGRIRVSATELITVLDVEITTNGILPEDGASIIDVDAPLLAINRSNIFSLIEGISLTPEALVLLDQISSGEANLVGGTSVVSSDTIVAATTNANVTGVLNDIDSNLQLTVPSLVNTSGLLNQDCFATSDDAISSMIVDRIEKLSANPSDVLGASSQHRQLTDAC